MRCDRLDYLWYERKNIYKSMDITSIFEAKKDLQFGGLYKSPLNLAQILKLAPLNIYVWGLTN